MKVRELTIDEKVVILKKTTRQIWERILNNKFSSEKELENVKDAYCKAKLRLYKLKQELKNSNE